MTISNLDKWRFYNEALEAPDKFIDWAFYWMIGASLTRCVWWGTSERPLYPSQYVFLVGDAGIGKGVVLKPVKDFLSFHRRDTKITTVDEIFKILLEQWSGNNIVASRTIAINEETLHLVPPDEKSCLFSIGADATTYEKLVQDLSMATRTIAVEQAGSTKKKIYVHNSMAIVSGELNNLFKRGAEPMINFFLEAFDSKDVYEYRAKSHGTTPHIVKNLCLNLIAGVTPDFMSRAFSTELLSEGFAARIIPVFEYENRFNRWDISEMSEDKLYAKAELLAWIKRLSTLYGQIKLSDDATKFLSTWYEGEFPKERANYDTRLTHYLGRKKVHLLKLIMAMHFADSCSFTIELETCQRAFTFLQETEKNMHLALQIISKNGKANVARNMERHFVMTGNKPMSRIDLLRRFYNEADVTDLDGIINYMTQTNIFAVTETNGKRFFALSRAKWHELVRENKVPVPVELNVKPVSELLPATVYYNAEGVIMFPKTLSPAESHILREIAKEKSCKLKMY